MSAFDNDFFEGFRIDWVAEGVGFGQLDFYYEKEDEEIDKNGRPFNRKLKCDNEGMDKEFVQAVLMSMIESIEF
jgi:hypothetical protein